MTDIEIVTHVYAEKLPQYAVFLRAQLTSLLRNSGHVNYRVSVCYSSTDFVVGCILNHFENYIPIRIIDLDRGSLFRRSIGRNIAAKQTDADIVWFTDVDHVFGLGCLESLQEEWNRSDPRPVMVWPKELQITESHGAGDSWWKANRVRIGILEMGGMTFERKNVTRAIGGIQIVSGDAAREYGYLDGWKKFQTPVSPDIPFPNFRDDVKYRKFIMSKGPSKFVDIKNLYRIRHSAVTYK